jgi:hypothetical protein
MGNAQKMAFAAMLRAALKHGRNDAAAHGNKKAEGLFDRALAALYPEVK